MCRGGSSQIGDLVYGRKMVTVKYQDGVFLPSVGLWLDPRRRQDFAFVSHAHSDHTGYHKRIICTPATARLTAARTGIGPEVFETMEFGERRDLGHGAVTLIPAGHVLGSAQLFLESEEGTLLYTGDFKRRAGLSSEPVEALSAETLIMETTYGLPRYRFPAAENVVADLVKFCFETLEEGDVPILLGYALGKAQEILSALAGRGFPIMLHGSVAKMSAIYAEFGIGFPPFVPWNAKESAGHVLICPPGAVGSTALKAIKRKKLAAFTGWALDGGAVYRMGVDAAFPLSDHADYDDLIAQVAAVSPRRVLTLHGFAQAFATDLRARGIEAWALTGANQLELDIRPPERVLSATPAVVLTNSGFDAFVRLCEDIRCSTGKLRKVSLLAAWLRTLTSDALAATAPWLTGRAFAQANARALNVGPVILRRALAQAVGRSEADVRASFRMTNDSGLAAADILSQCQREMKPQSLADIAAVLSSLASSQGPAAKTIHLSTALRLLHPLAGSTLVRILTGDLRIGLKEGLVEEALAEAFGVEATAVREANMLTGDIGQTAVLAMQHRLANAKLAVFRPIKCMLASPEPDAESIWARLGGSGSVWLEDKMDGIRAQVHCTPDRAEIYSRDLKNITSSFPEIARAAAAMRCSAIFDGEILAWDQGRALPFFELQKRLGRHANDLFFPQDVGVAYLAFDVVSFGGQSCLADSLRTRRSLLEQMKWIAPLAILGMHEAISESEIDAQFDAARERGNEGLVAKDPASAYSPGRRGHAWIKLKKQFATLDVVVVAVEYGHGRRSRVLSDYTFAVRRGSELLVIGKAYSGLTDVEIEELTAVFLGLVLSRTGNRIEVEPRIVLEVAFDAIQRSDRHSSGLALRFPRIIRIRRDKSPDTIDTLAAAKKLLPPLA